MLNLLISADRAVSSLGFYCSVFGSLGVLWIGRLKNMLITYITLCSEYKYGLIIENYISVILSEKWRSGWGFSQLRVFVTN